MSQQTNGLISETRFISPTGRVGGEGAGRATGIGDVWALGIGVAGGLGGSFGGEGKSAFLMCED